MWVSLQIVVSLLVAAFVALAVHAAAAASRSAGSQCAGCGHARQASGGLLCFARCRRTCRCSKEGQRADWQQHKQQCRPISTPSGEAASTPLTSAPAIKKVAQLRRPAADGPAFEVVAISGKGMGLVATRDLSPGEIVVEDRPLITAKANVGADELLLKVKQLAAAQRDAFYALSSFTPAGKQYTREEAIFHNNMMPLGECTDEGGLFPIAARANHSCQFNVHHSWNPRRERQCLIAWRSIRKGEEICIMYSESGHEFGSRDQRQQHLQQSFGFTCTCDICQLCGKQLEDSDRRRRRIVELDDLIYRSRQERRYELSIAQVEERLELLSRLAREEHVVSRSSQYRSSCDAYTAARAMRNQPLMLHWIQRAHENSLFAEGHDNDHPAVRKYRRIMEQVRRGEFPEPECCIM